MYESKFCVGSHNTIYIYIWILLIKEKRDCLDFPLKFANLTMVSVSKSFWGIEIQ